MPDSEAGEDKLERRITVEAEEAAEVAEEEARIVAEAEQHVPSLNFGDVLFGER